MTGHLGLAIVTFIVTNIDDLLILSLYFASGKYKTKNIVLGQYAGIAVLTGISLLGLIAGQFFAAHWVSLLGIFPFLLGIKNLLEKTDTKPEEGHAISAGLGFLPVMLVTLANGGDNIGVYTPVFANIPAIYITVYIVVFLILTGVWCALGYWIVKHPEVKTVSARYGKTILPVFLIGLGLFILKDFVVWLMF